MNKIIILPNRYGEHNELVLQKEEGGKGYYTLNLQYNALRVIAGKDNSWDYLSAIDPSGGPYMSIGYEIDGMKLIEINNTQPPLTLVFEKNEK